MKCITHGLGNFDPLKFREIKNSKWNNKPTGGLWCSPVDSSFGWEDWCKTEEYYQNNGLKDKFEFDIDERNSKILKIDSYTDLQKIPSYIDNLMPWPLCIRLDFETLKSQGYDAIYLTLRGLIETKNPFHDPNLCGWDCESILIMNKDIIKNIIYYGEK